MLYKYKGEDSSVRKMVVLQIPYIASQNDRMTGKKCDSGKMNSTVVGKVYYIRDSLEFNTKLSQSIFKQIKTEVKALPSSNYSKAH
jgi:hypothetical protein